MQNLFFVAFSWDDANRRKCQQHGVSIEEIEHVLTHAATLIMPTATKPDSQARFLAIGRTRQARYMHRKEIRKYEKEIARLQER